LELIVGPWRNNNRVALNLLIYLLLLLLEVLQDEIHAEETEASAVTRSQAKNCIYNKLKVEDRN